MVNAVGKYRDCSKDKNEVAEIAAIERCNKEGEGRILWCRIIFVFVRDRKVLAIDTVGEVHVRCPYVVRLNIKQREVKQESFLRHLARTSYHDWQRSFNLVHQTACQTFLSGKSSDGKSVWYQLHLVIRMSGEASNITD